MRRFKPTRESYIPKKSIKVSDKASDAIAYVSDDIVRGKVLYSVTAFCAKRQKPDLHIYCKLALARESEVRRFFESRRLSIELKAKTRDQNKPNNRLVVGQVLTGAWGYDQTNVEAWQVIALVGAVTVKIQRVGLMATKSTGDMSGYVIPCPNQFTTPPEVLTKRVFGHRVRMDHCSLTPWEGRPLYESSYA
jgi:hypothetical protein